MADHPGSHPRKASGSNPDAPKSIQQRRTPEQIRRAATGRVTRRNAEIARVKSDAARIAQRKKDKAHARQHAEGIFGKALRAVTGRKKKKKS